MTFNANTPLEISIMGVAESLQPPEETGVAIVYICTNQDKIRVDPKPWPLRELERRLRAEREAKKQAE